MSSDPYKVLGLRRGASKEEVRRAYRQLARKHHPDANPGDGQAEERFKRIQQAYEELSRLGGAAEKPGKTGSGDARRSQGRSAGARSPRSSSNLSDLLGDLSRRAPGTRRSVGEEDVARVLKFFGLDSSYVKNARDGSIEINLKRSRPGVRETDRQPPPDDRPAKPPKPPKPPIP